MKPLTISALTVAYLLLLLPAVQAQDFSKKSIDQYVWDPSLIYPSDQAWTADLSFVQSRVKTIGQLRKTMGRSARDLANAMDEIYLLRSTAAKMAIYGSLKSDVNIRDEEAQRMNEVAPIMERSVESSISFLADEISKIGKEKLTKWITTEPQLQRHKRRINRIFLEAEHANLPEVEAVIESAKGWPRVSADGFFSFYESDLPWPTYTNGEGKNIQITLNSYPALRRSKESTERTEIPKSFLSFLRSYETLLGHLYTRRIDADFVIAKHKKFADGIDCLWYLRDGVPEGTYKTMIEVARNNKPLLKQYASTLSKVLQIDRFSYQDYFALPKSFSKTLTIQESWDIVFNALAPLGKEYVDKAKAQISKPTIHLVPSDVKRGFYSNHAPIGGIPSFSMMTFTGTYGNLRNLISMSTSKVRESNIPVGNWPDTQDDPPIYGNAMLYVSEMLLDDYLIKNSTTKEEKIFHLHNALYRLWTHAYRELINTELDASIQQMIIEQNPPSGRKVSETYLGILRNYYGEEAVDDVFAYEWMTNSVQFLSYENQFWPAAMAAACLVYEKLKSGEPEGKRAMDGLFGKGNIDLSYGMLKTVGVDVTEAKTYQAMYDRMKELMTELNKVTK